MAVIRILEYKNTILVIAMTLKSKLKGSCVALVTPFTEDSSERVNFDEFSALLKLHLSSGTSALVPCGTTGETPTLSDEEWDLLVKESISAAQGTGVLVMPGTGSNSTKKAVQLTQQAAEMGADACLVVTPYYNKPNPDGLVGHFKALNSVGIPLVLYNVPGRTGLNVSPDLFQQVCDACPNVVAMKAANGNLDEITEVIYRTTGGNEKMSVLSGDDSLTLPIIAVGGSGVISVAANVMPKTMAELVSSFLQGQHDVSLKYMQAIHKYVYGLLKIGTNPCAIKYSLTLVGHEVGSPRLPLAELNAVEKGAVKTLMTKAVQQLNESKLEYDEHLNVLLG